MDPEDFEPDLNKLVREINAGAGGDPPEAEAPLPAPTPAPNVSRAATPATNPVWTLGMARADGQERLTGLLDLARRAGASDLLLVVGRPPAVRIDGRLQPLAGAPLDPDEATRLCAAVVPPERREALSERGAIDFSFSLPPLGRFRANVHRERGFWAAAIRFFPRATPSLEDLHLPSELNRLADLSHGLVLVTGPTGCGKTTTLAALLQLIAARRALHVITIEDPIEYDAPAGLATVEQIEIGRDALSFPLALRSALRQDPDVLLVGEMRDLESISIAITAAETGHLVLSTLHTGDGAQTVSRIVDAYPPGQIEPVRAQLAVSLAAVISQQLVPRAGAPGRVPAVEIMWVNDAVRNLIRKGQLEQIKAQLALGRAGGMRSLDQSLADLVRAGLVEFGEARGRARHAREFELLLPHGDSSPSPG